MSPDPGQAPTPLVTVFTPTYNRSELLKRTYKSVASQTFRDFEWLVVDDGSTDDTASVVAEMAKEADFPIRYIFKENGGIHSAYNAAVPLAKGRYLMIVASDDEMVPEALEKGMGHWNSLGDDMGKGVFAVCGLAVDQFGTLIGTRFPKSPLVSNSLEIRLKYKVKGDKSSLVKTEILKDYPFPQTEFKKSLFEEVIWNAIAKRYQECFVNDVFQIKHLDTESITRGGVPGKNAESGRLTDQIFLNENLEYLRYDPVYYLKKAANYYRCCLFTKVSFSRALKDVKPFTAKILVILGAPIGWIAYQRDLKKIRQLGSQDQAN